MPIRLFAASFVAAVVALSASAQDDPDPIRDKLDKALATYKTELAKARTGAERFFEKREGAARQKGDKKSVDQLRQDSKAFALTDELPAYVPLTNKQEFILAHKKVEQAYSAAIKDYVRT
ncbi:hypothetical protein [Fimbriiglobus ruber]|uniref:Uncharacterized protein n=1 Tax=Fimbriiglobus ruber TaxID=1908690 RepID=A0A225EDV4_9BACT|nr:hypothetical protein [Fimbriiglobus ruber]OWK46585.1 hypothetical protein FRUB_00284 [Fimbriiglobus ruber]